MSSSKDARRKERAQEAATLRRLVGVAGKTKPPATEAAERADEALEQE
jgi:hypothetical protein